MAAAEREQARTFARRAGAAAPEGPGDPRGGSADRPGTIGAVLTAVVRDQLETLVVLDGAVRLDQPDAVHRMRVAVRRLRSTLRAHRRSLDPAAEPLAAELGALGRSLGAARDSEVVGGLLPDRLAALPATERPGPMHERISAWSAEQYRRDRDRLLTVLDGAGYLRLLAALDRFAADPVRPERAGRAAGAELRRVLKRERLRVTGRMDGALGLPPGAERDQALHAARKAAKRARYAAEGARPVCGKRARRLVRRMKALQELLGERQDSLLARQALLLVAAEAQTRGEPGFGYGVLYAAAGDDLAGCDRRLPEVWAATRRGLRRLR